MMAGLETYCKIQNGVNVKGRARGTKNNFFG